MIGKLFTDRVPVGFCNRIIPFVIKPDRACVYPYYIRDCDMLPWFCQDNSSIKLRGSGRIILIESALPWSDRSSEGIFIANVFHSAKANQIIMTGQEISVNIPPTLDPVYSNMIQIAYKDDEFTFMFLHQLPQVNQARAKAIVSITPAHAKNLLAVLTKTVADYESKFGTISASKQTPGTDKVTTLSGYS